MKACAFFGHRDGLYENKRQIIKELVTDLIKNLTVKLTITGKILITITDILKIVLFLIWGK